MQPALGGGDHRDVGDPAPVRLCGRKPARVCIGRDVREGAAALGSPPQSYHLGLDPGLAHEPRDAMAATRIPARREFVVHSGIPVGLAFLLMNGSNLRQQATVRLRAAALRTPCPAVVPAR